VTIADSRGGNPKTRPAVVLTETNAIGSATEIQVAAVTTQMGVAPFSDTVELPSSPTGHPQTKLRKRCEVVCDWLLSIPVGDVRDSGGQIPPEVLAEILEKVARLN
jgi:mRNA-degrading endonuclease toxin of MazEF toxin-antitoxin module